jgi:hypothetical protein
MTFREQFAPLALKALRQFLNDQANDRLKSAITGVRAQQPEVTSTPENQTEQPVLDESEGKDKVVTSQEELDGFNIVRAIVRTAVDVKRVVGRDTLSYFGVLLDDNNRKPVCRLHFNRAQKYIGLLDENKTETRHPIDSIDDIFNFSEQLTNTVKSYELP